MLGSAANALIFAGSRKRMLIQGSGIAPCCIVNKVHKSATQRMLNSSLCRPAQNKNNTCHLCSANLVYLSLKTGVTGMYW